MTRDDIIRMAREAGILEPIELLESNQWRQDTIRELERFAALVAAAEREACAKNIGDTTAAWTPIEQPYPPAGKLDILMGDGSILCGVIPQEEGDLWWSGTAEKFIDPQYYDITHWRIHCDTAAIRARGQDPMPLFDDWGGIPYKSCPPCNQQCNQGRDCPNA